MKHKLDENIAFVNDQVKFHSDRAGQYKDSPRAAKHLETKNRFLELIELIQKLSSQSQEKELTPQAPPRQLRLTLTPQEVDGLPDELLEELSISKTDKVEYAIINTIEELGGVASLDQLLVYIYKTTGEIQKRTTLTNRLYRMAGKGTIYSVPDKKGIYSLEELPPGKLDELIEASKNKRVTASHTALYSILETDEDSGK